MSQTHLYHPFMNLKICIFNGVNILYYKKTSRKNMNLEFSLHHVANSSISPIYEFFQVPYRNIQILLYSIFVIRWLVGYDETKYCDLISIST